MQFLNEWLLTIILFWPAVAALFETRGYHDVRIARDYARIERVVSGAFG